MFYWEILKKLRTDDRLSQQKVAEYLNVKQNTYSQYESGTRQLPLDCLIKLSALYDVSTDYILGLTDDVTPPHHK